MALNADCGQFREGAGAVMPSALGTQQSAKAGPGLFEQDPVSVSPFSLLNDYIV